MRASILRVGVGGIVLLALCATSSRSYGDVDLGVANGDKVIGTLLPADEVETFRVRVPKGALLSVIAKGKKTKGRKGVPAVTFRVLDSTDTDVSAGRVSLKGNGAKLKKLAVGATGEYRVVLTGDGTSSAAYQLSIKWTSPKRVSQTVDLTGGPALIPVSVDAGAQVTLIANASRGSSALPQLSSIDSDVFAGPLPPRPAGSKSHKVSKFALPGTDDYLLTVNDGGAGGAAKVTIKVKSPKPSKRRIAVTSAELGEGVPFARGSLIGAAGGDIVLGPGDAEGLAGAAISIPAGALPSAIPIVIGSAVPILAVDIPGDDELVAQGPTVFFGPHGTTFAVDTKVTIPFDPTVFEGDFTTLVVVERDGRGRTSIVPAGSYIIDEIARTVSFAVSHFTSFRAFGPIGRARQPIQPLGLETGARLGRSVAIDGDTAVIGASTAAAGGVSRGAVYVYVRQGSNWVEQQRLTAVGAEDQEFFGHAVTISGDRIVVGAFRSDFGAADAGGAYYYERVGTTWSFVQRFTPNPVASSIDFASTVSLDGTRLAVGAPFDGADVEGTVYVYELNADPIRLFVQTAELHADSPVRFGEFGIDVSLDGDGLLIGARGEEAAYVFVHDGQNWAQQDRLVPVMESPVEDFAEFGFSVALSGGTAVVGRPSHPGGGSAYVFDQSGSTWTQTQRLEASDAEDRTNFGWDVAIEGGVIVAGRRGHPFSGTFPGAAYAFVRVGTWVELLRLPAAGLTDVARFGRAVAIGGTSIVVGAPEFGATSDGAFYVFSIN